EATCSRICLLILLSDKFGGLRIPAKLFPTLYCIKDGITRIGCGLECLHCLCDTGRREAMALGVASYLFIACTPAIFRTL
ncbi:hypothetical protein CORC01_10213, partial [Colletotrichum orchidophilum]